MALLNSLRYRHD